MKKMTAIICLLINALTVTALAQPALNCVVTSKASGTLNVKEVELKVSKDNRLITEISVPLDNYKCEAKAIMLFGKLDQLEVGLALSPELKLTTTVRDTTASVAVNGFDKRCVCSIYLD